MGFADMYLLQKYPVYYGEHNYGYFNYSGLSYYYPQLLELGLTHVVTDADLETSLNTAYNSSIKILDMNFAHTTYKYPFRYAQGVGNNIDHLPYEVGGSYISLINNKISSGNSGTNSDLSDIYTGLELEKSKQINKAVAHYKKLISNKRLVTYSLTELMKINHKYPDRKISNYFMSLLNVNRNKHSAQIKNLIAAIHLQKNQFNKAIKTYDDVTKNYTDNYQNINARFGKLFAYLNIKKDRGETNKILSEIKSMNLKDDVWKMRLAVAENLLTGSSRALSKSNIKNVISNNYVPKEYSLLQNYPNPFNPTTTINYTIPQDGTVTLKIYNILGAEVMTLVNEAQTKGKYQVTFDASDLSSGIYIYRIKSRNFFSSKKMILLK